MNGLSRGQVRTAAGVDARGLNAHREINADGTPRNIITHAGEQAEGPVREWTYDRRWMGRDPGTSPASVVNGRERTRAGNGEIIFHGKVDADESQTQLTPQKPHLQQSGDAPSPSQRGALTARKMLEEHRDEGVYSPQLRGDPNAAGRVRNSMGSGNIITGDLNDTSTPRRLLNSGERPMDHKYILDHDVAVSSPGPFTRRLSSRGLAHPTDHGDLLEHDKAGFNGCYHPDHALGPKPQLNYKHKPNDTANMLEHQ